MRELLEAVAAGKQSPAQAEAAIRAMTELDSYIEIEDGRFDAAREYRSGVPEVILATGKSPAETAELAKASVQSTDRAIITRVENENILDSCRSRLTELVPSDLIEWYPRSMTLIAYSPEFQANALNATLGVISAGTSDAAVAEEAALIAREMGVSVDRIDDIGVAGIARLLDNLESLREHDILIVAAGREGALPTVIAGLVDVPVIGLPTSNGYGYGGKGDAALQGMLQSCTALSVVNIDAGFTAGAQAGLIARTLDAARSSI